MVFVNHITVQDPRLFHVKQGTPHRRTGRSTVHVRSTRPAGRRFSEQAPRTNPQSYPQQYPPGYPPVYPPFPRLFETPHLSLCTRRVPPLASSAPLKEAFDQQGIARSSHKSAILTQRVALPGAACSQLPPLSVPNGSLVSQGSPSRYRMCSEGECTVRQPGPSRNTPTTKSHYRSKSVIQKPSAAEVDPGSLPVVAS